MEALLLTALVALILVYAIERLNGCDEAPVQKFDLHFNGERLTGYCLLIDRRSWAQRHRNEQQGHLDGDVLLFMHGHGQPPQYGYHLTSLLAQRGKSGLLVIPMVHTPFGTDSRWRGDSGKTVLLMALARQVLAQRGIGLPTFQPICDLPLTLRPRRPRFASEVDAPTPIEARVTVIGWSHGGVLARRFAHAYPTVTRNLAQMTPAGFESWGQGTVAMLNLLVNFIWESLLIAVRMFRGEARHVLVAGWAILRGIGGDMLAAWNSIFRLQPISLRLFRPLYDVHQCSLVLNDRNAPVDQLEHLVVLFGRTDSVFEARNAVELSDSSQASREDSHRLFETYYPQAIQRGTKCTFKILPGNHIGPLVHADLYATELLRGVGELKEEAVPRFC